MKRQKGKKKGQTKERVFGCDLLTHLQGTGQDVPQVLKVCAEFIEQHGIVDGIYRLSGISSNIQKLRQEFDTEKTVDLSKEVYLQDIHCVSSLCKAYFRELPNPLLMYRLYDKFADAVNTQMEADRLLKIRQVLQELPPSHHRTLEYLMRHLLRMASHSPQTNMHSRNLAIVWAPNLLRSKEIEMSGFNGTAAFMEVRVQSIVVEFILNHVHQLFSCGDHPTDSDGDTERCQSLPCLSPGREEVPGRTHPSQIPHILHLGDGPPAIRPYHAIIELPENRRKGSLKVKKWRSIFNLGRSGNDSKRKLCRNEGKELKTSSLTLRPAKSMDSLSCAPFTNDIAPPHGDDQGSILRRDSFSSGAAVPGEAAFSSLPVGQVGRAVLRGGPESPRSARDARERAGRPVALHISGPFSVSLPQHLAPLLHRTLDTHAGAGSPSQGPRGPSLQDCAPGEDTENEDTAEEEEEEEADGEEEDRQEERELFSPTQLPEITLELQDTFSFLDNQDMMEMGDCDAEYSCELGRPLRTPEEMDPSEYFLACDHGGAGGVDMSIESELMEQELDMSGLQAYHLQLQLPEFSVEPPCEEWALDEPPPLGPTPPAMEGTFEEELDPTLLEPSHPRSCMGNGACSTSRAIAVQEGPSEAPAPSCSTGRAIAVQEDPSEAPAPGCSTSRAIAVQEDPSEAPAPGCSTSGAIAVQEDPSEAPAPGCSTGRAIAVQEDPSEAPAPGCSTGRAIAVQEDPSEAPAPGCSTGRAITVQEDPSEAPAPGCSTSRAIALEDPLVGSTKAAAKALSLCTGLGTPAEGTMEAETEGCSTGRAITEQTEATRPVADQSCSTPGGIAEPLDGSSESGGVAAGGCWSEPGPKGPGTRRLVATPMRLESWVVPCHQARALPVVPPKPHYAMLPPALKARSRGPALPPAPGLSPPLSPSARCQAWRKKGSQSFDEVVARRRGQQGASPQSRPFIRGDSLPSAPHPLALSSPRDRLSLPPTGVLSQATGSHPQPRCHSLALEVPDSE